jgi:hypothetical protein
VLELTGPSSKLGLDPNAVMVTQIFRSIPPTIDSGSTEETLFETVTPAEMMPLFRPDCYSKMPQQKWLVCVIMLAATLSLRGAEGSRPNFSGRWELDKTQSDLGPLPGDDSFIEFIEHQEPKLTITQVWKNAEGEHTLVWQLTTDGAENTSRMNQEEIKSRTTWEDNKLVTEWKMKNGDILTEGNNVRFLSADSKTQTIRVRQRTAGGDIQQLLVFVKTAR